MRRIQLVALLVAVAFATGCPNRPKVQLDNNSFIRNLNDHLADQQLRYYCAADSRAYTVTRSLTDPRGKATCNESLKDEDGPEKARKIRNQVIEDSLGFIDADYADFVNALQTNRARGNFIADVIELGTSAAVGITQGERSIQVLGVALTAFRGGRKSVDLNFYREQTTPILIAKMDDNRSKVYAAVLQKKTKDIDEYSINEAIRDVVAYYNAGTLVRAFTELQKDTASQAQDSADDVLRLQGVQLSTPATKEFRDLSVQANNVLVDLNNALDNDGTRAASLEKLRLIVAQLEADGDFADLLTREGVSATSEDGKKIVEALVKIRSDARALERNDLLNKINQAILDKGK
jgi:hypothetical protein